MSRNWSMYLDDMIEAIESIIEFSKGMTRDEFFRDKKSRDATLRNLEILGEASKKIPEPIRNAAPEIPWRRITGLRDILAHNYFGLDEGILWDVVTREVPRLLEPMRELTKRQG